jgi:AcrR family transcriptional regulator
MWESRYAGWQMVTADPADSQGFTAKGLATRERILTAAAHVILSDGVTGFSLDKVRRRASVSGSQLTHYFVDKQTLIGAVLERQIDVVLDFHRQPKLHGLTSFADWDRWADLNMRYLRKIGFRGTPTYHTLAGQLAKSDEALRQTFADGYWRWGELLEESLQRMKDRGVLIASADPRTLALVVVAAHQGSGCLTFAYRQQWTLADATRFVVNYLRLFASDPADRILRRPMRPRGRRYPVSAVNSSDDGAHFTRKGLATRARIVEGAAELMFERGVSGTSLDDVRVATGVSGSQLSHYFADKADLTRRVIAARADFVVRFHLQPRMDGLDTIAALRTWADVCWAEAGSGYLRNGCVYGSLTGELLEGDDDTLDELAAGYDRWLKLFQDGLAAMRRRGELRDDADPRHLAVVLVTAHQGGTMITHLTRSAEPFRALVDAAIDYVESFTPPAPHRAAG